MKKQIIIKIISIATFSLFAIFFLTTILPLQANAAGTGINWENPNANGDNPYKITTDAILNSQTLMQVVGCTGVVNGVTKVLSNFMSNTFDKGIIDILEVTNKEKYLAKICEVYKGNLVMAVATVPSVELATAIDSGYECPTIQKTSDTAGTAATKEVGTILTETQKREACFNGLAYTLAKNQLTSMTRETLNWINSGFNGNPLYVQNMRSLTNSIERNVIETGIQVIADGVFPYGGDFNRTVIQSYNGGAMNSAEDFLLSLQSDLSAFITDQNSYWGGNGNSDRVISAKQRAIDDNYRYANDFSVGGWDGWMAITQRENNNPLGFTMQAAQYLADRIDQQAGETQADVASGGGFMSQKQCVTWNDEEGKKLREEADALIEEGNRICETSLTTPTQGINDCDHVMLASEEAEAKLSAWKRKCTEWRITTPGSIIKEKLSAYINSPERQLEMADTINKSLSSLFTKLIENFRSEGLFWLSQEKYSAYDEMIGYGVNGTDIGGDIAGGYGNPIYSSGYSDNSFSLTRDLGNTYIHDPVRSLGTWNAKNNIAIDINGRSIGNLNVNLGVYDEMNGGYESPNYYFTVTDLGNTKLYNNGYNGWAVGDRAFWNGTEWQNWKCIKNASGICTYQSPIAKRGIIQTQVDYVVAAKKILEIIPGIMPKIGELDYCIPGPNPNFEANSTEASAAFNDLVGSISGKWDSGSFFVNNSTTFSIAGPGSEIYDTYANIFKELPTLLETIPTEIVNGVQMYSPFSVDENGGGITQTQPWLNIHDKTIIGVKFSKNAAEDDAQAKVTKIITNIQKDIENFYTNYKKQIFDVRFGTMKDEFLLTENSSRQVVNTDYVPMIEEGYAATKDIVAKNKELLDEAQSYRDTIVLAELNTSKLNDIKSKVSAIIKDAQKRRDENEAFQGKIKTYFNETDWTKAKVLYEKYKIDNKSCFNEEDLSFFDEGDTVVDTTKTENGRCGDGLDNDRDGLADTQDSDCQNLSSPVVNIKLTQTKTSNGGLNNNISWSVTNAYICTFSDGKTNEEIEMEGSKDKQITEKTVFKIACTGEGGTTTKDVTALIVSAPSAPINLSATPGSCDDNSLTINWRPSTDGSPASNFKIYDEGNAALPVFDGEYSNGLHYSNLTLGSTHKFKIRATNFMGSSDWVSFSGTVASACGPTVKPVVTLPPNASCSTDGTYSVGLSWSYSATNVTYTIFRVTWNDGHAASQNTLKENIPNTTTTYTDSGLIPGNTYAYEVLAVDSAGKIVKSTEKYIELPASLPACVPTFTLNYSVSSGGTITGNANQTGIPSGGDGETVTATCNSGYTFFRWSDNVNIPAVRKDTNVKANINVSAMFKPGTCPN